MKAKKITFSNNAPGCTFSCSILKNLEQHKLDQDHNLIWCNLCGMVLKNGTIKSEHLKKHETPTDGLFMCRSMAINAI